MDDKYFLTLLSALVCLALLNFRRLLLLRNLFVFKAFLIYALAPVLLSADEDYLHWQLELTMILAAFFAGYAAIRLWPRSRPAAIAGFELPVPNFSFLKKGLYLLIGVSVVLLGARLLTAGSLSNFYNGTMQIDAIENYGKSDAAGAVLQIFSFILSTFLIVFLAIFLKQKALFDLHATDRHASVSRFYNPLLLLLGFISLVVLPLLYFNRSQVFYGVITFLFITSILRIRYKAAISIILAIFALFFFVYAGFVRDRAMGGDNQIGFFFNSELSPFLAYRDLQDNIDTLGYQYGNTIIGPYFLKLIPRGMMPEKPQNSGGYIMENLHPREFEAGFALAPTYMGCLYLNFGLAGVVLGTFLLGLFSGYFDRILILHDYRHLGLFVLVFYYYFPLLRDDTSNILFLLSASVLVYLLVSNWTAARMTASRPHIHEYQPHFYHQGDLRS